MKILFIIMRFGKDGLATNIAELADGLVNKGHEVHIITGGFKEQKDQDNTFFSSLRQRFANLGIKMHYFKEPQGGIFAKGYHSLKSLVQIIFRITKIKPEIIHCHSPNLTFIPWLLGKKFTSTVHADTIRPNARYKHPTLLIAVSEGSKNFTETVMHTPPESIRMVYHGIPERFSEPETQENLKRLKREHQIPEDKIIIGLVGRITQQKGTDVLVKAIGQYMPKELIHKIFVVIVGDYQTPKHELWLEGLLEEHKLTGKLKVLGFQDPKPFYQLFDVFVLPSRSDTFGLVAVEAMMGGCCTIRSNGNGASDQIEHGVNGMIFPMEDSASLGKQLTEVLTNDDLRKSMALKGREKALACFTLEKMTSNTLKVYQELKSL
ncbi:glycosyltransferase family 4 protein [Maribacter litopenaei]|uniref:Glycosyltransferase family 4 protein n=1 Tax=Maribacter litopenaei TaxID=2976127 RepID=A0ABY5YBK8_9FLAO|nr:glycosyltransferase family 4 protein [Maribacter litopenaei]UWX56094.1 glycosyltransferase family 4 protein [Maribacter litopenaei]